MFVLAGEQVRLRDVTASDAAALTAMADDDKVWAFTRGRFETTQIDAQIAYMTREAQQQPRGRYSLAIEVPGGVVAGLSFFDPNLEERTGEIGWFLASAHWGRGFASEATRLLLGYGFDTLGLESIEAIAHPDNVASVRVLEKHGFRRVGDLEQINTWQGPQPRARFEVRQDGPPRTDQSADGSAEP